MLNREQTAHELYVASLMSAEESIEDDKARLQDAQESDEEDILVPTWPGTIAIENAILKHEQACLELAAAVECIYCRKEWEVVRAPGELNIISWYHPNVGLKGELCRAQDIREAFFRAGIS